MSYAGETPNFKEVILTDNQVLYVGDKDTDGSWRIIKSGADLNIEVRAGGVWVPKDEVNP